MSEQFSPWDAANYLHTEEDARLYLEACIAEDPGDGSLINAALGDIARSGNMTDNISKLIGEWYKNDG